MADTTNYIPKRKSEIEIPDFLRKEPVENFMPPYVEEVAQGIEMALEQGRQESKAQSNAFHLKELDKVADAYNEDEAKVIIKRLVSNYPDIVLGEVVNLIKDMQELSGAILKNSRIFASKRGEV